MKPVCIFFMCLLSMASAKKEVTLEESRTAVRNFRECIDETGVEVIDKEGGGLIFKEPVQGCFTFCIFKREGQMNQDGTANKDVYIEDQLDKFGEEITKNDAEQRFYHCQKLVEPGDGCKMAVCLTSKDLENIVNTSSPL